MIIRNMTQRITFVNPNSGVNEDGEAIRDPTDEFTCWAEVQTGTLKEFRENSTGLTERKETFVFLIRHQQKKAIDTTWQIRFKDQYYEIIQYDPDYSNQDMDKIKGQQVM